MLTPLAKLCAVLALFATALTTLAEIQLTDNGTAIAVIVTNGHTEIASDLRGARGARHIKSPAAELQTYLQQITGAELALVANLQEAGDKPAIVLQLVDKVPGTSDRETADQAYRIHTEGNRLILTAATPLGLHYAVYGLLEDHLDCRFYTFSRKGLNYAGPGFEVVPAQPSLTLADIDEVQEPHFPNRGIIFWMGSYPWILKNRGIGARADQTSGALAAGHNMYQLLPPKPQKEQPGLFEEHPGFYPLNKAGQREPTWAYGICGTNEQLPTFLAQGLERAIATQVKRAGDKMDWSKPFSAGQGDGFSGCMCEPCRSLVHEERSEAAPLILALNRAIDIVHQTYPQAQVITFSYFETLDAPKNLKPHDALWINVVSSARSQNMAGDQMGLIAGNPANRDYARAIQEWPKIAPGRVTVWHWDTYRAEWPSMFYLADNLRFMRDAGIYGVNPQYCGGPWVDLLAWVYLKLAWDMDADADALIRQYCSDNYGKEAGAHVYNYLKLAQQGYEQSLHVPSAVRWSGWTPLLRLKLFPPALLQQMTDAMDMAMAAAEKAGDQARLGNLIAARGQSLDVVKLNAAAYSGKPWGTVRYEGDGKHWFVTGADPQVPAALMRAKKGIAMDGGGEAGVLRTISGYAGNNGGPVVQLASDAMSAIVCPDLKGQIVSAVDRASGKELLSVQGGESGYKDAFGRISAQIWLPVTQNTQVAQRANDDWSTLWSDFENPAADSLQTDVVLSPSHYGFYPTQYLRRTVTTTGEGLRIERQFIQEQARNTLRNPSSFNGRWLLALPDASVAKVAVKGGGIDQLLDLRYAVPGDITGVRAGERLPGADYMDERFDTVIAVSAAEATTLTVDAEAGNDIVLRLDRGDGTAAVLTTPAAGWATIEIKPVVDKGYLEVNLIGQPQPMGTAPNTINLPVQTLSARVVPPVAASSATAATTEATAEPRIRRTSETTAVNEIDGAELIWIPAGDFLRGSPEGVGGGDEWPQRTIHLDGYWIYKYPVTLAQYLKFCEATGKEFKPTWGQDMHVDKDVDDEAYPVQLNWYEAGEYARWAAATLPTDAQWEKAARGTDGRRYPWGNEWDPDKCTSMENSLYQFRSGFRPSTAFPAGASPYGVMDMAGNVWEWVADWFDYDANANGPDRNPTGPETGSHKILRGGVSLYDERFSTTTARMVMPPHVRDWTPTGFRCVVVPTD